VGAPGLANEEMRRRGVGVGGAVPPLQKKISILDLK